jgi:ABC-type transport system involved in cytochrome bd biosynthesis fused ATPase/permease subunit
MQFSLAGILAVLSHAIPPFLPLILAILALLVVAQLVGRLRGYRFTDYRCLPAAIVALLAGLSTLWWLPRLTGSRLAFVATAADWAALVAAVLGVALITWLVLHPLSYLVRGPRRH